MRITHPCPYLNVVLIGDASSIHEGFKTPFLAKFFAQFWLVHITWNAKIAGFWALEGPKKCASMGCLDTTHELNELYRQRALIRASWS